MFYQKVNKDTLLYLRTRKTTECKTAALWPRGGSAVHAETEGRQNEATAGGREEETESAGDEESAVRGAEVQAETDGSGPKAVVQVCRCPGEGKDSWWDFYPLAVSLQRSATTSSIPWRSSVWVNGTYYHIALYTLRHGLVNLAECSIVHFWKKTVPILSY